MRANGHLSFLVALMAFRMFVIVFLVQGKLARALQIGSGASQWCLAFQADRSPTHMYRTAPRQDSAPTNTAGSIMTAALLS
jgi:hypothetical protein